MRPMIIKIKIKFRPSHGHSRKSCDTVTSPSNSLIPLASASIDSISKLLVGSSKKREDTFLEHELTKKGGCTEDMRVLE